MENLRTSLVVLNIDIGLATLVCLVSLRMGTMRTSLAILNIDRGLAYLGVSGELRMGYIWTSLLFICGPVCLS